MANMNGNDPNRLLNETRAIDRAIDELEGDLGRLGMMQNRAVEDTNPAIANEVDRLSQNAIVKYKEATQRVKRLKSDPESGNPRNAPQVGKVNRRLKTMINKFQQQETAHRKQLQDAVARQYRIVRPDASDAEVREAVEDSGNTQVFSQAVRPFLIDLK
jgi:syntaxin 1B/2/3